MPFLAMISLLVILYASSRCNNQSLLPRYKSEQEKLKMEERTKFLKSLQNVLLPAKGGIPLEQLNSKN